MRIGICEFKKPVNFKNGYIAKVGLPIKKIVCVEITDISKDEWQLPLIGTKDVGNPKLKTMSRKEFRKTFTVTHIQTIVGDGGKNYRKRFIMNQILLKLMKWLRLA